VVGTKIVAATGAGSQAKRLLGSSAGASLDGVHSVVPTATGLLTTLPSDAGKLTSKVVGAVVGATGAAGVAGVGTTVQSAAGAVSSVGATGATQLPVVGTVTGAAGTAVQGAVNTINNTLPIGSH
jgi:hypothetical protein